MTTTTMAKFTAPLQGFPPVADPHAKVLVLGSMPGVESLYRQQYYAHPRNAFWPVMQALFNIDVSLDYPQRCDGLLHHRIALWDVIGHCTRRGSLDTNIQDASIRVNDFPLFFTTHAALGAIFFNGARAEQEYRRRVLPYLAGPARELALHRLPSTSPAMASLTLAGKVDAWSVIARYV